MRSLLLGWVLAVAVAAVGAQPVAAPLDWKTPTLASEEALESGRPILLLWQAGPSAPSFTQSIDRLFTSWPQWTAKVKALVVPIRGRSWEGSLPSSFPLLPGGQKTSLLALWNPTSGEPPTVWLEPPPVLELSRRIASVTGLALEDPYGVPIISYEWEGGSLVRRGEGPKWSLSDATGTSEWVEEGPLGTVLVLRETASGRRAAFPLDGEWSFLFDSSAQSWAAWNPVLVKRQ